MKHLKLSPFIGLVFVFFSSDTFVRLCQTCTPITCQNGGVFDLVNCRCNCQTNFAGNACQFPCNNRGSINATTLQCQCFPNWNGQFCNQLNCNIAPPAVCRAFNTTSCTLFPRVFEFCPHLCGRCTATTASPTTARPLTTANQCLNGGSFNTAKRACSCFPNYYGQFCEMLNCTVNLPICRNFNSTSCRLYSNVFNYCPVLCGRCNGPSTQPPVTSKATNSVPQQTSSVSNRPLPLTSGPLTSIVPPITPCVQRTCKYGIDFDPLSCSCACPAGFTSKPDCSDFDCSSTIEDDPECDVISCADPTVILNCPRKCSNCATISCKYGIELDLNTGTCACPEGFQSKPDCSEFDCSSAIVDLEDCDQLSCTDPSVIRDCPRKCFNCPTAQ